MAGSKAMANPQANPDQDVESRARRNEREAQIEHLLAQTRKALTEDRWHPWYVGASLITAGAAMFAAGAAFMKFLQ